MNKKEEKKLPEEICYKGYIIKPSPYELADDKGWTLNTNIQKHSSEGIVMRNFFAKNIYKTREEAVKNCFIFGRQIIDGKYENLTVTDL